MSNEQSPITNFEKFILVLSLNNNLYLEEMRIYLEKWSLNSFKRAFFEIKTRNHAVIKLLFSFI